MGYADVPDKYYSVRTVRMLTNLAYRLNLSNSGVAIDAYQQMYNNQPWERMDSTTDLPAVQDFNDTGATDLVNAQYALGTAVNQKLSYKHVGP